MNKINQKKNHLDIEPPDYRVPFEEDADRDPTLSEITRIVCHDKIRPILANQIGKNLSSSFFLSKVRKSSSNEWTQQAFDKNV